MLGRMFYGGAASEGSVNIDNSRGGL